MIKKHAQNQIHLNDTNSAKLRRASAIELNADGADVPIRFMAIPAGTVSGRDGRWWKNDNPQAIVDAFNGEGVDLPIDYEHGSEFSSYDGQSVPAAGWIKDVYSDVNGAIWVDVEWTAKAAEMIGAKEYRYISPAFATNDKNSIIALSSIGLVQHPNLAALPALNNKTPNSDNPNPVKEREMKKDYLIKLCALLGLQAEAADDVIVDAVAKIKDDGELALNSLGKPPSPKDFIPRAEFDAVKTELSTVQTELSEIATNAKTVEIEQLVDDAVSAGKIIPANKQHYVDVCKLGDDGISAFKSLIAGAAIVNTGGSGSTLNAPTGDNTTLTDFEKSMCSRLNLTAEQFIAAR